jgi:hypothetical protein
VSRKGKVAIYAAAVAALLATFALYEKPEIRVAVADMIWACFH